MKKRGPPAADRIIGWLVPPGDFREGLLGDLHEEFNCGEVRFRALRYWVRILGMAPRLWLDRSVTRQLSGPILAREVVVKTFWNDAAFAVRLFGRRRSYAVILLLTTAAGIGAATSMFSLVDGVLIRSLPYPESDRLVSVHRTIPRWREDALFSRSWDSMPLTWLEYREWQERQTTFASVGAYVWTVRTLAGEAGADQVDVLMASASLLNVLGLRPLAGRSFGREEEGWPGARVALISDGLWRGRFAGDPAVLGRSVVPS